VILKTQNLAVLASSTSNSEVSINMKLNLFFENTDIDKYISVKYEDGAIYVTTDFPVKTWGTLEIQLPKNIGNFEVETSNSKCILEDLKGIALNCSTSNGKIEIKGCTWQNMDARTNNSKILISNSQSSYASIDTSNGGIELDNSAFDKLKSNTSNGSIYLNRFDSINDGEAEYMLQTSNGKIKITLPKNNSSGYSINARTSLGNINIPELEPNYIINRKNGNMRAEASVISSNFETFAKKILIEAVTSNSSINIAND